MALSLEPRVELRIGVAGREASAAWKTIQVTVSVGMRTPSVENTPESCACILPSTCDTYITSRSAYCGLFHHLERFVGSQSPAQRALDCIMSGISIPSTNLVVVTHHMSGALRSKLRTSLEMMDPDVRELVKVRSD